MNEVEFGISVRSLIRRIFMQPEEIEERIVYKVVRLYNEAYYSATKFPFDMGAKDDKTEDHLVEYKIGEACTPKEGLGPLMAFEDLESAKAFIGSNRLHILKCIATISKIQPTYVSCNIGYFDVLAFWKGYFDSGYYHEDSMKCWDGTIFCDSVTPIEEVPND